MKARKAVEPALARPPDPVGLLTVFDVAAQLRVRPALVRALAAREAIGYHRVGRALRFRPSDVEAYLAQCYRPARG